MTRRERDRFIQEEELGPTAAAHHLAPPPLIVADTDEPCLGRPALLEQRLGRRVVNDAAVAREEAPLRYRDNVAERAYSVLQGNEGPSASAVSVQVRPL